MRYYIDQLSLAEVAIENKRGVLEHHARELLMKTTDEDEKTALQFHLEFVEKTRKLSPGTNEDLSLATLSRCLQDVIVVNEVRTRKSLQWFWVDAHLKNVTGFGVQAGSQALADVLAFLRHWPMMNTAHVVFDVLHPTLRAADMTTIEKMHILTKGFDFQLVASHD